MHFNKALTFENLKRFFGVDYAGFWGGRRALRSDTCTWFRDNGVPWKWTSGTYVDIIYPPSKLSFWRILGVLGNWGRLCPFDMIFSANDSVFRAEHDPLPRIFWSRWSAVIRRWSAGDPQELLGGKHRAWTAMCYGIWLSRIAPI